MPTPFKAKDSVYDKQAADNAVAFIECLSHTKGTWAGQPFLLIDWQEKIIRDVFGTLKPNGYRQFNTAYIEIPKKNGKSELAAAVALQLQKAALAARHANDIAAAELFRHFAQQDLGDLARVEVGTQTSKLCLIIIVIIIIIIIFEKLLQKNSNFI